MRATMFVLGTIFLIAGYIEMQVGKSDARMVEYWIFSVALFLFGYGFPRKTKRYGEKIEQEATVWPTEKTEPIIEQDNHATVVITSQDTVIEDVASPPFQVEPEGPPAHREEELRPLIEIVTTYSLVGIDRRYRSMYHEVMELGTAGPVKKLVQLEAIVQASGHRYTRSLVGYDRREQNPTEGAVAFDFVEIGLRIPEKGYIKVEF